MKTTLERSGDKQARTTPPATSAFDTMTAHLEAHRDDALVHRLALRLVEHLRMLSAKIDELAAEITERVTLVAPSLLAIVGCGPLTAAKIIGETAQVHRFRSKDAFARHNGTAPLPVWSSNKQRHRLSRTGNRQLNAALHRIAMTKHAYTHPARELMQRRKLNGDGGMEALRSSNDDSPMSSTAPCSPTKNSHHPPLLDRGRGG